MTPSEWLEHMLHLATPDLAHRSVKSSDNRDRVDRVCRSQVNRACVRLLMACFLAKLDRPENDPRKPYTEIGTSDSFSGRGYDEQFVNRFVQVHRLPCNSTTAFLTPVLRNINRALTPDVPLIGRPRQLYDDMQFLLQEVGEGREEAADVLADIVRILVQMRDERLTRLAQLQDEIRAGAEALPLSTEAILTLIGQHLDCNHSSRLPVLVVVAAYRAVADRLGERPLPLHGHNAADEQTGASGDVEIMLDNDDHVRTVYEMKQKTVTLDDLDRALQKIASLERRIDNYIIITTDRVEAPVLEYAATLYEATGGTEFAILDCLGFLRHFLHLFHRSRGKFLEEYQSLLLAEPDSAGGLPLKEAFLALRRAAVTVD